jgi:hypothetical protein
MDLLSKMMMMMTTGLTDDDEVAAFDLTLEMGPPPTQLLILKLTLVNDE